MAAESFFTWGAGGAKLTPEQIALARQLLARKSMQGADTSPVQSWTQGAARVADAIGDVIQGKRLDSQEKDLTDYNSALISNLIGGGSPSASAALPSPGASAEMGATAPAKVDMTGNQIYGDFINTVKEGGVQNPYALAAIAATGKAESGFSPGNVNRTWDDPSASGQPGRAGGIMSWRGPRYAALAATGDLSPAGQARFFLQEDPKLIAALNGAKSVDEAQSLMNRAWAFRGYDQPGGESARRLSLANGFLPTFQGQRQPTQVASLDPAAGMPAPEAQVQIQGPQPSAPPLPPATTVAAPPPVASVPAVSAVPVQAPAPNMQVSQNAPVSGPALADAMKVLSDPRANANTKAIAEILVRQQQARQQAILEQQLKQSDPGYQADLKLKQLQADQIANPRISPTDQANIDLNREKFGFERESSALTPDIKEYKFAKDNGYTGSFAQYQLDLKKSAANNTTINTGEGNKFYNTLDENNAKIFSGLSDAGIQGRSKLGQIDQLEGLLNSSGTGALAVLKQRAGDLGINTEGLSDIQAASAMLSKMIPEQRAPGSGPVSDADLAGFRNSLPRLINQPGGNATIINTMRGLTQYQIQMGEIADRVANRELKPDGTVYSPADGRRDIANLPNPLSNFKAPPPGKEEEGWKEVPTDIPGVKIRRKN